MAFDYFYGDQSDLFAFYRVPKRLFTDPWFHNLSTEGKTLYGILLDRMSLSAKNGWLDEDGRVYIIFTVQEIRESLSCGNKKAISLLDELENKVNLIERKRQGLGKPNLIYVKNFCSVDFPVERNFLKCQNDISVDVKTTPADVSKAHSNNTDISKTEYNDTDSFLSSDWEGWETDELKDRADYERYFQEQFQLELLIQQHPYEEEALNEMLNLVVDTVCSKRKTIRIASDDKPLEVVKSVFMKLDREHISMVLSTMKENTTLIRNMKQYLLAALYNAPLTINNYYSSLVQHHMATGQI